MFFCERGGAKHFITHYESTGSYRGLCVWVPLKNKGGWKGSEGKKMGFFTLFTGLQRNSTDKIQGYFQDHFMIFKDVKSWRTSGDLRIENLRFEKLSSNLSH